MDTTLCTGLGSRHALAILCMLLRHASEEMCLYTSGSRGQVVIRPDHRVLCAGQVVMIFAHVAYAPVNAYGCDQHAFQKVGQWSTVLS